MAPGNFRGHFFAIEEVNSVEVSLNIDLGAQLESGFRAYGGTHRNGLVSSAGVLQRFFEAIGTKKSRRDAGASKPNSKSPTSIAI